MFWEKLRNQTKLENTEKRLYLFLRIFCVPMLKFISSGEIGHLANTNRLFNLYDGLGEGPRNLSYKGSRLSSFSPETSTLKIVFFMQHIS